MPGKFRSRSYLNPRVRYLSAIANSLYNVRRSRYRSAASSSIVRARTLRRGKAVGGITSQYDQKTLYRRKKAPRRIRKIARKRNLLFRSQMLKSVGSRTVVFNSAPTSSTNVGSNLFQCWVVGHLYGCAGTNLSYEVGCEDLQRIRSIDNVSTSTADYYFGSAVMDITCTNTSEDNTAEIDLYVIWHYSQTAFVNLATQISNAQTTTTAIGTGNSFILEDRGITLFDLPQASLATQYKIVKKIKYFVPAGSCFTWQYRDPKNRKINTVEMLATADARGYVHKKWTKSILILAKPLIGATGDVTIVVGMTRKYLYKQIEQNNKQDVYNP